jgi:hypothetical protein
MADPADGRARRDRLPPRAILALHLTLAAACVLVVAARVVSVSLDHLAAPHDLVLESPQVSTIGLLARGVNVYSAGVFDAPPFNVTIYPPAYHLLVSWLPWHDPNPFVLPRLVSAAFMVGAAALVLAVPGVRATSAAPWLAIAFFFSIPAVTSNTMYARHDPMALFFAAASVVVLARARSPVAVAASAALAVAAIATKQSSVAAALAGLGYLAARRPRHAAVFLGALAAVAAGLSGVAHAVWGPGFWWSILVGPAQPWDAANYSAFWAEMGRQTAYWVFAGGLGVLWLRDAVGTWSRGAREATPFLVYLPAAVLVLVATLGKRGAHVNYFFEPTLAGLLYLGARSARVPREVWGRLPVAAVAAALCLGFVLDFRRLPAEAYSFTNAYTNAWQRRYLSTMAQELDAVKRGDARILVDPGLANRSLSLGRTMVLNDAYLYRLLWAEGKLSIDPLLSAIRGHAFDIVVLPLFLEGVPAGWGDRFYPTVARHYRVDRKGLYYYLVPRTEAPAPAAAARAGSARGSGPAPHAEDRLADRESQDGVEPAGEGHHPAVPDRDVALRRHGAPEEHPVPQRGQQADAVQVAQHERLQPGRRDPGQGPPRVPAVVSDGGVERRVVPGVGGRQDDERAAGAEAGGRPRQLVAVGRDVLEHVDVRDGIEARRGGEVGEGPGRDVAAGGQLAPGDRALQVPGHVAVGLQADPAALAAVAQRPRRGADPRPDLQHLAGQVRAHQVPEIGLPVPRPREQVQLAPAVHLGSGLPSHARILRQRPCAGPSRGPGSPGG